MRSSAARGLLAAGFTTGALAAQQPPARPFVIPNTFVHELRSSLNGRLYSLSVAVPASYAARPAVRFPVFYMYDGNFPAATNAYRRQNIGNDSLILVVIWYGDDSSRAQRIADFALPPPSTADSSRIRAHAAGTCCRAALSARVLREEIIPFIEREYRASDDRGLLGHSASAVFAAYLLFTQPELFSRYAITSPSPWTESQSLFEFEADYAAANRGLARRVFISVGSEENPYNRYLAQRLSATLRARGYEGLDLINLTLLDETHGSLAEYSRALRALYPLRTWLDQYGDQFPVKDSVRVVATQLRNALQRRDMAAIRRLLVADSSFQGIVGGRLVTGADAYVAQLARTRGGRPAPAVTDSVFVMSDDPNGGIFVVGRSQDTWDLMAEVRRRAGRLLVTYVLHADTARPPSTTVRVMSAGGPVADADVRVEYEAGTIAQSRTDSAGFARLAWDWHWGRAGYLVVEARGFQRQLAAPPNRDSTTVMLRALRAP